MKTTWNTNIFKPCPCYDPIVFGHIQPCARWESRNNNAPPAPGHHRHLMTAFQISHLNITVSETAQAMQRFRRTVENFNALMREINEANETASHPTDLPAGPA